jgi:hypothetical protein
VKKSINKGSEINTDIAYLYRELGVTLHSAGEIVKAMTCVRKVINIYESLRKTNTVEYVNALSFMGEMMRDVEDVKGAVKVY